MWQSLLFSQLITNCLSNRCGIALKVSGSEKKQGEQEHKHFLKRVNRKLKELSRFSRAKQRQM